MRAGFIDQFPINDHFTVQVNDFQSVTFTVCKRLNFKDAESRL